MIRVGRAHSERGKQAGRAEQQERRRRRQCSSSSLLDARPPAWQDSTRAVGCGGAQVALGAGEARESESSKRRHCQLQHRRQQKQRNPRQQQQRQPNFALRLEQLF